MHKEAIEQVEAALADWPLLTELPPTCAGFHFSVLRHVVDDRYDIFCYDAPEAHRCVTAYYHEETHEYKLRERVGYIEFCRIEYITADLAVFTRMLADGLMALLEDLVTFRPAAISSLVHATGIFHWTYGDELPAALEGYTLFIRPSQPVKITNGSYILIDYVDFEHGCDVTIYYNMYRNEFFGEARIHAIPDVTYDFDSSTLAELEQKLDRYLVPRMRRTRALADAETAKKQTSATAAEERETTS